MQACVRGFKLRMPTHSVSQPRGERLQLCLHRGEGVDVDIGGLRGCGAHQLSLSFCGGPRNAGCMERCKGDACYAHCCCCRPIRPWCCSPIWRSHSCPLLICASGIKSRVKEPSMRGALYYIISLEQAQVAKFMPPEASCPSFLPESPVLAGAGLRWLGVAAAGGVRYVLLGFHASGAHARW